MFKPSRIGTPLATSVPRVRVVRAMTFFSTSLPITGQRSTKISQPMRPALNLRTSLIASQITKGRAGMTYQYRTV